MKTKKSLILSLILTCCPVLVCAEQLAIAVVGDAQRVASVEKTLLTPFSEATGIDIRVIAVAHQDGADAAALLQRADSEKWDFLTLNEDQALRACSAGDLAQTGIKQPRKKSLLPALSAPATCHSFTEFRANTMVYNLDAYRRDIPNHLSAFFDLERFPGKRAIATDAVGLLELALMGYGVPAGQVYHMLSTTRGVALAASAFAPLKNNIIWATSNSDTERLLSTGAATMASTTQRPRRKIMYPAPSSGSTSTPARSKCCTRNATVGHCADRTISCSMPRVISGSRIWARAGSMTWTGARSITRAATAA